MNPVTQYLAAWGPWAWVALDIVLVAVVIYQVLIMIRGTRAAPMLAGVTVIELKVGLTKNPRHPGPKATSINAAKARVSGSFFPASMRSVAIIIASE